VAWGLAAFAAVGVFVWIGANAFKGVPFRDYSHYYVSAPQVGNLLQADQVRIGGVRVGQVSSVSLGSDGRPRVRLQIEPGTALPADTEVRIRANGLLGARYVQLLPGSDKAPLAEGATIRGGQDALSFGVSDALDTLDAPTRRGVGQMAHGLGLGFAAQGENLNEAVRRAPDGVTGAKRLAGEIARDRPATQRLLPSLNSALQPLAAQRENIGELLGTAADALQPFAEKQPQVGQLLERAPSTLAVTDRALRTGRRLLVAVTGLATEAERTVPLAPTGLRRTAQLLRTSHEPLKRAASLLDDAGPAVPGALRVVTSVKPLLKPLQGTLAELRPMLDQSIPYGCDIENWGAVMRSMDGFGGVTDDGPVGPLGAFRAQAATVGAAGSLGIDDGLGLTPRDTYPPPCKYLASEYPQLVP
jgi:virulence factor Mce-like protein